MKNNISRMIAMAAITIGSGLLFGCGNDDQKVLDKTDKKSTASKVNEQGMTAEGARLQAEFEERNKPLKIEFSAPSLADSSEYLDIQSKLSAIQIYTAKRNWEESPEEMAKSISGSILIQSVLPDLYQLETKLKQSSDAFEKRELTEKIASLVKEESGKINGNIRVKMIVDADLKSYDFDSHVFASESCLYSEKLEYSKEEMKSPSSYAKAQKPRCYIQPSTTNFLIGVVNGAKLNIKIDDINVAKKIEAARSGAKFEIFGYVAAIERERVGGRPGDMRHIMIEPQLVNVIAKSNGEVLYSETL